MSEGTVPLESLQVTIVTLPKPGKSPDTPAKFRAISLLSFLPMLINADQVGFIKGRQALDGTRRLLNILSHAESSKIPTIFLSLDAKTDSLGFCL